MKRFTFQHTQKHTAGFTLVEFIVIISIFAIIATVSLFNSGSFNRHTAMTNLTHDIALVIRQAQNYGMGSTGDINDVESRYPVGVQFEYDGTNNRFLSQMILFRDMDADGNFDPNIDMLLDNITFRSPVYIDRLRYNTPTEQTCTNDFAITFKRPLPDPSVYCGQGDITSQSSSFEIVISNDVGVEKTIRIQVTGLISVD